MPLRLTSDPQEFEEQTRLLLQSRLECNVLATVLMGVRPVATKASGLASDTGQTPAAR
ncbi:MAG: hypothetical protein WCB67_13530 [Solirubrobacteraceae bacterium]